jgi:hypothetical protein
MTDRICGSFCNGFCGMDYDEDDELSCPSSMDDNELCLDDGEDKGCDEFFVDDEVCDYCGEPLGFCASDCETRDADFEEDE